MDDNKKSPPWYLYALKFKGKKETDPEFQKIMVPKWKIFGLNLGTISKNWAAWCGLAMAVVLYDLNMDYPKNGATAKNWDNFGISIDWKKDGIPQGAIVRINHRGDCGSATNNHVAQANGDCNVSELILPNALIDLYGGNQNDTWQVSSFPVSHICSVHWPKSDLKPPLPVMKSNKCSEKTNESKTK